MVIAAEQMYQKANQNTYICLSQQASPRSQASFFPDSDSQTSFHGDRNSYHGDRNSYHGDRNSYHGDRNSFYGDPRTPMSTVEVIPIAAPQATGDTQICLYFLRQRLGGPLTVGRQTVQVNPGPMKSAILTTCLNLNGFDILMQIYYLLFILILFSRWLFVD